MCSADSMEEIEKNLQEYVELNPELLYENRFGKEE